ncbi:MAG: ATP-dependent DNA helicase RecQ [Eudoraea sp.]|uniref:RecQ family ATP-dependent DNA helicase n=1 Tax=Eudoraea sp. TaxID=1979955 RepID=UPI003C787714
MNDTSLTILKKYWGYDSFKPAQEEIIDFVLKQKDVLALLPTGGGKSLCYQIPSLLNEGLCIVVSPLIALIQNQVQQLKDRGIKAIALTGGISQDHLIDLLDNCVFGKYKFLYLSPERLQQHLVQERIQQMTVNLIAVDEAHCISQWGNDFRPAYLNCAILRDIKPETPIIALTATATPKVAKDIVENLQFKNFKVVRDSFDRSNISFSVIKEENKQKRLLELCASSHKSGIVYVRSRRMTQHLSDLLNKHQIRADFYHGGLPKEAKKNKLKNWLANKTKIMIATNAFGMGIDKADVDMVIHYQMPDSMENYYQEAGRAGRDGEAARAILLTNKDDTQQLKNQFLEILPDVSFIKMIYKKLSNYFQIPYGIIPDGSFPFSIESFSETYKLPAAKTYNALRILDQNSIIGLSQNYSRNTNIQFITSKQNLRNYLAHNKEAFELTQTLLRTYGGVFDFETKINILLLSKKTGLSEDRILIHFEQFRQDEIVTFKNSYRDVDLVYLVPREDDLTINVFASKVKQQIQTKVDQIEAMLAYTSNDVLCRKIQILNYFGEKTNNTCKICDVCLQSKVLTNKDYKLIKEAIIELLRISKKSSRELNVILPYQESSILKVLRHLLEEDSIQLNATNEYVLKK